MSLKEELFQHFPHSIKNFSITFYNTYQYKIRHGGDYKKHRKYYSKVESFTEQKLLEEFEKKKNNFFSHVKKNSSWYQDYNFTEFDSLNVLEKEDIINSLDKIKTVNQKDGLVSMTGGTTGSSMKVIYTKGDIQERNAILDNFRSKHGYELGKRTAWFSGKNLISREDIEKGVCAHYDLINKIKFYSTFHINEQNFHTYWTSLNKFKPEFIVGFPSSVYEICKIADSLGLCLHNKVNVFFPTAETVLPIHREIIGKVLGCKVVDQYSSSEGAPFILECEAGNLHIHPLTGIFEVVDENNEPAVEGELLVTSFTTYGTPLVRYRIGDSIKLSPNNKKCSCLSIFPMVEKIDGRSNDYILSPTYGKVNLGNISNSTKGVAGVISFQVIQKSLDHVDIKIVTNDDFDHIQEAKFVSALQERIGDSMTILLDNVDYIERENSGKFRIVKNLISEKTL